MSEIKNPSNDVPDPGTTTMHRLRERDNPAWTRLVDQYFDGVYQWCLQAGLDEHSAADVAQEVFLSALGSLHRFQRGQASSFGGWLRRICQRRINDYWRRKKEQAIGGTDAMNMFAQLQSIRHSISAEDRQASETIEDERLISALARVQDDFEETTWRAFWMVVVESRSALDTAKDLQITQNAVYVAKSRVSKRLRQYLGESGR